MGGRPWLRKRVDFIAQMEATECGAAALAMVLAHHGHHAPLAEVRQACGISRDGASALALVKAAHAFGLEAEGVRLEVEDLFRLPLPAILHWDFDHFVVLERVGRTGATLVDPAHGRRRVDRLELGRSFTGAALLFRPTPALAPRARMRPSLAKYREVFRRNLPSLTQILLATLVLEAVGLATPVASQLLLDRVLVPRQAPWLWGLALGLGSAAITAAALGLVRGWVALNLHLELNFALTGRFLGHMLRLPLGFFLQRDPGDLAQRAGSSAEVQDLLSTGAVNALLDGFLLLGFAALMIAYHPRLAGLVLALSLVHAALLGALWDRNRQLAASGRAAAGREGAALLEALSGLEATKASGAEGHMVRRWANRMTERVNLGLEAQGLTRGLGAALGLFQGLAGLLVFGVGGREVLAHRMTLGTFVAFLTLQGLFMAPLGSLLAALLQLQSLGTHLRRLDDVLETAGEPRGSADPGRLGGAVELRDVTFRYAPGGAPALDGLNVRIAPGETVALVGPTGAGKSTLARLFLGLHLPDRGTVRFDGRDLRELDLGAVRRQIGVVMQETFLFDDTVRANLALHDGDLSQERLLWAARMACVDDVIAALPRGFDSRVGENGSLLSGGQRQRLSLARALAHDPAILVLDEATSSLDPGTEARIQANLARLGCTRILIAHRLATLRDADRILVLQGARIVQEGPFGELQAAPGLFRDLLAAAEPGRG
ncbi:NHLP family bacteriocin export ABC transporter peptidase/permease/ATPase [Mesoterricola silvestris]|uniref:NHLP family bacteriocin export ABC transporter peptidase/permease/ATPase n=2 Tax=Mesoterricola silvestris TaxID=2927979 RepID=A0AA48H2R7_9BACT|nr:NHLP family bacteriocin export ABC transporter peptidase/permease/ATPase [Mesoterricola silvestris]